MEFSRIKIMFWIKRIGPIAFGAVGGFLYFTFVGCNSNSCAITSDPYVSTIYGAVVGSVFTQWGNKKNEKADQKSEGKIKE